MKIVALLGAGLLALLFRPKAKTAWTNAGLPTPVGTLPELETLARELAAAMRQPTGAPGGLVLQFQRRAGLVSVRDDSGIATASGIYDGPTRQALGYYGRLWREETP